jgi:hypothetical protein
MKMLLLGLTLLTAAGAAPASAPKTDGSLADATKLVTPSYNCDPHRLYETQPLHARLKALLGPDYEAYVSRAAMCGLPVDVVDGKVVAFNYRQHSATVEDSLLVIDPVTDSLVVKLLVQGKKVYTYEEPGKPLHVPEAFVQQHWPGAVETPGRVGMEASPKTR